MVKRGITRRCAKMGLTASLADARFLTSSFILLPSFHIPSYSLDEQYNVLFIFVNRYFAIILLKLSLPIAPMHNLLKDNRLVCFDEGKAPAVIRRHRVLDELICVA